MVAIPQYRQLYPTVISTPVPHNKQRLREMSTELRCSRDEIAESAVHLLIACLTAVKVHSPDETRRIVLVDHENQRSFQFLFLHDVHDISTGDFPVIEPEQIASKMELYLSAPTNNMLIDLSERTDASISVLISIALNQLSTALRYHSEGYSLCAEISSEGKEKVYVEIPIFGLRHRD